jgi:hypothetical protein
MIVASVAPIMSTIIALHNGRSRWSRREDRRGLAPRLKRAHLAMLHAKSADFLARAALHGAIRSDQLDLPPMSRAAGQSRRPNSTFEQADELPLQML